MAGVDGAATAAVAGVDGAAGVGGSVAAVAGVHRTAGVGGAAAVAGVDGAISSSSSSNNPAHGGEAALGATKMNKSFLKWAYFIK